jgi:hypothetical protein
MARTINRALGLTLALTSTLLTTACAVAPPRFEPAPTDPLVEARIQQMSPMAGLDTGGAIYQGELPPTIAPVDKKTDDLGDIRFLNTKQAVASFGEQRIRQHVVKDVKLCARVELQKIFLAKRRQSADHAEAYFKKVHDWRKGAEKFSYAGQIGGNILGGLEYGPAYAGMYFLGSLVPGMANQATYGLVLDENDVAMAEHLADKRDWYGDLDLWLDSMHEWCPAFMGWVENHGQIVSTTYSSSYTPYAPAAPRSHRPTKPTEMF